MTESAAVQTPATDEVVETPEPTERDILAAAFDKANAEPEEAIEAPADPVEDTPEPEPTVEVPTDLPGGIKAVWKDLPDQAREAFLTSHRDLSQRYSQATRQLQGIGPIGDAVKRAAQEIPGLKDMTPQQIANDVFELAKVSQAFSKDKVGALRGLMKQHGIDPRSLVEGQQPQGQGQQAAIDAKTITELRQQVTGLQSQLQRATDPNALKQHFATWNTENTIASEVNQFAADKPHWQAVEPHLPRVIPVVQAKLGPNATPAQVLQEAYDMAVTTFVPDARAATTQAGDEPAPEAPQRVKAAVKAKSVNVRSEPGGKSKPVTEREKMEAVWDRLNSE